MAHSFIMFFLIATGVEMKDMEKAAGWGDTFRRRTINMKSQVFPAMTFALLLVLPNFVMGAAAHTRAVPQVVHSRSGLADAAVLRLHAVPRVPVLGDNNRLIAEAASRREDTPVRAAGLIGREAISPKSLKSGVIVPVAGCAGGRHTLAIIGGRN